MIIAVDFDGTVVDHRYPLIGKDAPYAVEVLKQLIVAEHKLILFTMRSGLYLDDAVRWFKHKEIALWGIQYNPEQSTWSQSNKCYANLYIDDAAFGCPVIYPPDFARPCVDWQKVRAVLL